MENKKRHIFQRITQRKNKAEDADSLPFSEAQRHQHDIVYDPAIPATCVQEGLTEGIHCSTCGEVIIPRFVVPRHEHRPVERPELSSTCTKAGYTKEIYCSECGKIFLSRKELPLVEHDVISGVGIPATCTDEGLTAGTHCRVCGTIITRSEIIPSHGHEWKRSQLVEPTCTENGWTEGEYCCLCNKRRIAPMEIPAHGHVAITEPTIDADCENNGLKDREHCRICGEVIFAGNVIPAKGHVEEVIPARHATCTKSGVTQGKRCSVCGKILLVQQVVPAMGHIEVIDPPIPPTYQRDGRTEGSHCSACKAVIRQPMRIPKLIAPLPQPKKGDIIIDACTDPNAIIYIVSGNLKCSQNNHQIIRLYANVWATIRHEDAIIPIQRCVDCGFYYIQEEMLAKYEEKLGKLWFLHKLGFPGDKKASMADWNPESELHKLGYNVSEADKLSKEQRHEILIHAIRSKKIRQARIMDHLAKLIRLNKNKSHLQNAIQKWQDDLEWLAEYDIQKMLISGKLDLYRNKKQNELNRRNWYR